jgi:NAD-reducing hydrogenase small subunit
MSFLDIDQRVIDLADKIELVYSPLVDLKEFPENVDVALVEGAVSSDEDLHKAQIIRARSQIVVSLGDCAVTSNVPSMRNPFGVEAIAQRVYKENVVPGSMPNEIVPLLLKNARPLHSVIKVDVFIPGCPPSADTIWFAVSELLAGRIPELTERTRFGA